MTLLCHAVILFVTHLAVVKIGMIVAENSVLRVGNDAILDNFKERITIIEETSKRIIYSNAAKIENSTKSNLLQDLDALNFIMICKDVFEEATADSNNVMQNLKEANSFYSIS